MIGPYHWPLKGHIRLLFLPTRPTVAPRLRETGPERVVYPQAWHGMEHTSTSGTNREDSHPPQVRRPTPKLGPFSIRGRKLSPHHFQPRTSPMAVTPSAPHTEATRFRPQSTQTAPRTPPLVLTPQAMTVQQKGGGGGNKGAGAHRRAEGRQHANTRLQVQPGLEGLRVVESCHRAHPHTRPTHPHP